MLGKFPLNVQEVLHEGEDFFFGRGSAWNAQRGGLGPRQDM